RRPVEPRARRAPRRRQPRARRRHVAMSARFPDWLVPMAATLTEERFATPEWLFERKYDGIRLISFRDGADVHVYSRNHLEQNLPHVRAAIAALPVKNVVLDGEVMWDASEYHVFDVLWLDGEDLRARPLEARLARLRALPFA